MSFQYSRLCAVAVGSGLLAASSSFSYSGFNIKYNKCDVRKDASCTNGAAFSPTSSFLGKRLQDFALLTFQSPFLYRPLFTQSYCYSIEEEVQSSQKEKLLNEKKMTVYRLFDQARKMVKQNENPHKIEMTYLQALRIAMDINEHKAVTSIQDSLANFHLLTNNLEKAQEMYRVVLHNLVSSGTSENDPSVLEITLKLASIYAQLDKHELAISGFEWTCKTSMKNITDMRDSKEQSEESRKKLNNQLALHGMALDSYGRYLLSLGKTESALTKTLEALDISKELFGETDVRTLVLYNDIASINCELDKLEEALEYVTLAIDTSNNNTISGITCEDKAIFLCNLAHIYAKQGLVDESENAFKQALLAVAETDDEALKSRIKRIISSTVKRAKSTAK